MVWWRDHRGNRQCWLLRFSSLFYSLLFFSLSRWFLLNSQYAVWLTLTVPDAMNSFYLFFVVFCSFCAEFECSTCWCLSDASEMRNRKENAQHDDKFNGASYVYQASRIPTFGGRVRWLHQFKSKCVRFRNHTAGYRLPPERQVVFWSPFSVLGQ